MSNIILAVASFGGHLVQLENLVSKKADTIFISTIKSKNINDIIVDCNIGTPIKTLLCFIQSFFYICKYSPDCIITTGALPGLCFIITGKLLGKKTIWVDSIANADKLSSSGKIAKYFATVCLTQHPKLASKRVQFMGGIL